MVLFVLGLLAPPAGARDLASFAGSCDGVVDYGDELVPDRAALTYTSAGASDGYVRVEIDIPIDNVGPARFLAATALPVFEGLGLDVRSTVGADYGEILPGARVQPDTPVLLEVWPDDVDDVMAGLQDGSIPFALMAQELAQVNTHVAVFAWTEALEGAFDSAANTDPGPAPWDPEAEWTLHFTVGDTVPDAFSGFSLAKPRFLVWDPSLSANLSVPSAFHFLVLDDVVVDDTDPDQIEVEVTARRSDDADLTQIYDTASFCSGPRNHVDWPLRITRLEEVDGRELSDEERDARTMPIRYNDIELFDGRVTLQGSVHGYALRPDLNVRVRHGDLSVSFELDSDLTFTGRVEAHDRVNDHADVDLWDLCFPLGTVPMGPVELDLGLGLDHDLFADVDLRADAVAGITKRVRAGVTVSCTFPLGDAPFCTTDRLDAPTDLFEMSPPQLAQRFTGVTDVGTRFAMTLIARPVGPFPIHPVCNAVTGGFVTVQAEVMGRMTVDSQGDPWWTLGHGASLEGHLSLELLGSSLVEHTVTLQESPFEVALEAPGPLAFARRGGVASRFLSGGDHRWMVALDTTSSTVERPGRVSVAALSDGRVAVTTEELAGARLALVDAEGALQWSKTFSNGQVPVRIRATPDDHLLAIGHPSWAARFDDDGHVLWARNTVLTELDGDGACSVADGTWLPTGPGTGDVVLVGEFSRGVVSTNDACVVRLDGATGDVRWGHIYGTDGLHELHGVTITRDGDIVAVGTRDSGDPQDATRTNGWIVRLDPDTGDMRWSSTMPLLGRGVTLHSVVETDDGSLVAVGQGGTTVRHTGSAVMARISADGDEGIHGVFFHDRDTDVFTLDFESGPLVRASQTSFDWLHDVVAVGDSVVVVGHAGYSGETGWAVRFGPDFGVDWMLALDGEGRSGLTSIALVDGGMVLGGHTESAFPGGTSSTQASALVWKVPFEGTTAVHPAFSDLEIHYVSPGVHDTMGLSDVQPTSSVSFTTVAREDALVAVTDHPRILASPARPVCARLLTPTGGASVLQCDDQPDVWAPTARIESPDRARYGWSETELLQVVLEDAGGLAPTSVTVDGADAAPGDTLVMAVLGLGEHVVAVSAEDLGGNVSEDRVTFDVYDDVPPTLAIRSPSATTYALEATPTVALTVDARDGESGLASLELTLDGAPIDVVSALELGALSLGEHELVVTVADREGNTATDSVRFSIEGPVEAPSERRCGCTSVPAGAGAWALLGLLVVVRRRRAGRPR